MRRKEMQSRAFPPLMSLSRCARKYKYTSNFLSSFDSQAKKNREMTDAHHVHDQMSACVALVSRLLETRVLEEKKKTDDNIIFMDDRSLTGLACVIQLKLPFKNCFQLLLPPL